MVNLVSDHTHLTHAALAQSADIHNDPVAKVDALNEVHARAGNTIRRVADFAVQLKAPTAGNLITLDKGFVDTLTGALDATSSAPAPRAEARLAQNVQPPAPAQTHSEASRPNTVRTPGVTQSTKFTL